MIWETIQSSLSGLRMLSTPAKTSEQSELVTPNLPEHDNSVGNSDSRASAPAGSASSMFTPPPDMQPIRITGAGEERIYEIKDISSEQLGPRPASATNAFEPVVTLDNPRILAQLKSSYLLGEDVKGLFIVDQHAAHERILFDQYTETYRDMPIAAQPLLFPVPLKLLPSERMVIKDHLAELKELGFTIQQEDDGQYYATAFPVSEKQNSGEEGLQDVLAQVLNGWESRLIREIKTDLLKMMACKAAVKAGNPLDASEWNSLLEQLLKTENPFTCPHGRPIVIRITVRQIETGFLRT